MATETEPIPNPVVGHSERIAGKSKKGEGLWEPNSERLPNRTAMSTADVIPNVGFESDDQESIENGYL